MAILCAFQNLRDVKKFVFKSALGLKKGKSQESVLIEKASMQKSDVNVLRKKVLFEA